MLLELTFLAAPIVTRLGHNVDPTNILPIPRFTWIYDYSRLSHDQLRKALLSRNVIAVTLPLALRRFKLQKILGAITSVVQKSYSFLVDFLVELMGYAA